MVQVLIVAKTKMSAGLCLGGLVLHNQRSVRLLPPADYSHPFDSPINLGEIWDF